MSPRFFAFPYTAHVPSSLRPATDKSASAATGSPRRAAPPRGLNKRHICFATSEKPNPPYALANTSVSFLAWPRRVLRTEGGNKCLGETPTHSHLGFRAAAKLIEPREVDIHRSVSPLKLDKAGHFLVGRTGCVRRRAIFQNGKDSSRMASRRSRRRHFQRPNILDTQVSIRQIKAAARLGKPRSEA